MANMAQKSGKTQDQISNFAQKCNLLSQYLKERGSFGDISLGINGRAEVRGLETDHTSPATTLNLLNNMENSSDHITSRKNAMASADMMKFMDFFPQFVGSAPPNCADDAIDKADHLRKSSPADPEPAQMTIFYAGKVSVFNGFPADKAKEIMALATMGSSLSTDGCPSSTSPAMIKVKSSNSVAALDSNKGQETLQLQSRPNVSDVPHARRASLHRFFSKRKDRVAARSPYQMNDPAPDHPRHPRSEEDSNLFLALHAAQSSKQLQLKL